jgi:hypothetical protein
MLDVFSLNAFSAKYAKIFGQLRLTDKRSKDSNFKY